MKAQAEEHGPPDLIVFTGDLAFKGIEAEYRLVDETLEEVKEAVGGDPVVVPVPGNHDLERPRPKSMAVKTFRDYHGDDDVRQGFIGAEIDYLEPLERAFEAYAQWWEQIKRDWDNRELDFELGRLPGDFVASIDAPAGFKLGVCGLNSTWLQLTDDENSPGGRGYDRLLAVESEQFGDIVLSDWAGEHDAAILLMHHPPRWLTDRHENLFESDIYPPSRFVACLFGHRHKTRTQRIVAPSGRERRYLQGTSLCGLERYATSNERREFGYSWGRISRDADGALTLESSPREAKYGADGELVCGESTREEPLSCAIRRVSGDAPPPGVVLPESTALHEWEDKYLGARIALWATGPADTPLAARAGDKSLQRDKQYISLRADSAWCWLDEKGGLVVRDPAEGESAPKEAALEEMARRGGKEEGAAEKRGAPYLEQVLSHARARRLVIVGEAGSGKSVLLQHVAYVLARARRAESPPEHQLDLDAFAGNSSLPIPILIRARAISDEMNGARDPGMDTLVHAIEKEIREATGESFDEADLSEGVRNGRYLLLVDALDEVPDEQRRGQVVQILRGAAESGAVDGDTAARLILTTRPTAQTGSVGFGGSLRRLDIARLDQEAAAALTRRWCIANGIGTERESRFLTAVSSLREKAAGLIIWENPLLLVASLLVYFNEGERLPDSLAELYGQIVEILCAAKPREGLPASKKREILEQVFASAQTAGGTEWPVHDARELLVEKKHAADHTEAGILLDQLADDTGLIRFEKRNKEEHSYPVLMPWHRSFQEYLAASVLRQSADSVSNETDRLVVSPRGGQQAYVDDPAWDRVLGFLVGVYGSQAKAQAYLSRLREHALGIGDVQRHPTPGRLPTLIATGLAEYRQHFENHELLDRFPAELLAEFRATGRDWSVSDRIRALDALGRLGDPRFDEDPWVELEGEFMMGGDSDAFRSAPAHRVRLPPFRMLWRPVTVMDFAPFVDGGGYSCDEWWGDATPEIQKTREWTEPRDWTKQKLNPSRPVWGVSWWEAKAFCRWASAKRIWGMPDGWQIDLPSETEWEFAARGAEGSLFPWGNEEPEQGDRAQANHSEEIGHVTPVGAFPGGRRGRLVDLAGNVWEWCDDAWRELEDRSWQDADECSHAGPPGAARVLRGGSWVSVPRALRCAGRYGGDPGRRSGDIGFRVVCRVPRQHVSS